MLVKVRMQSAVSLRGIRVELLAEPKEFPKVSLPYLQWLGGL